MLSMVQIQRNRLKNMIFRRITNDFEDYPVLIKRIIREEKDGCDIGWKYGGTFEKVYRMMIDLWSTIENSDSPYEDPAVNNCLEKYEYYISPTGCHIYGAGPRFSD